MLQAGASTRPQSHARFDPLGHVSTLGGRRAARPCQGRDGCLVTSRGMRRPRRAFTMSTRNTDAPLVEGSQPARDGSRFAPPIAAGEAR